MAFPYPFMWPFCNVAKPVGFPNQAVPNRKRPLVESEAALPASQTNGKTPKRQRRVPENQPCLVCSQPATGLHYTVAACDGCKTFFRRAVLSDEDFRCQKGDGSCVISQNRNACRRCRLDKCIEVGMDEKALGPQRDKRSAIIKLPVENAGPEPQVAPSASHADAKQLLIEHLTDIEQRCNVLRFKDLGEVGTVSGVLSQSSWLYRLNDLADDPEMQFTGHRPATMSDVQVWNVREMRLLLEWAKTMDGFLMLCEADKICLVKNFAMSFTILNRVYYSLKDYPDTLVYPTGAYIGREPHDELRLPACKWTCGRQIVELQRPFRELHIEVSEFALFKAVLFFNKGAFNAARLSPRGKTIVSQQLETFTSALVSVMLSKQEPEVGGQRLAALLLTASSLQGICDEIGTNLSLMEVFDHFWQVNGFVKEICNAD
ncbi:nuclear hormone receptor family member nhr-1 [Aphelenchoides avenae]|nr:nuclear hormone receptor family member nhr-1 [Aphelenchus avenae]